MGFQGAVCANDVTCFMSHYLSQHVLSPVNSVLPVSRDTAVHGCSISQFMEWIVRVA